MRCSFALLNIVSIEREKYLHVHLLEILHDPSNCKLKYILDTTLKQGLKVMRVYQNFEGSIRK